MISNPMFIAGFIFLSVLAVYDLLTYNRKKGMIPAPLTSLFIVIALLLGVFYGSIERVLYLGALGVALAYFLTDLEMWEGWADFKCFVAGAMLVPDVITLMLFAGSMTFFSFVFKAGAKSQRQKTIPFIPIILVSYLAGWVLKLMLLK